MSVEAVRRIVLVICVAGIAGMIASSIAASTGGALTFGLITAAAVLCTMVATAVTSGAERRHRDQPLAVDEAQAAKVEHLVRRLMDQGVGEDQVRALVSEAVRLGRGASGSAGGFGGGASPSHSGD